MQASDADPESSADSCSEVDSLSDPDEFDDLDASIDDCTGVGSGVFSAVDLESLSLQEAVYLEDLLS